MTKTLTAAQRLRRPISADKELSRRIAPILEALRAAVQNAVDDTHPGHRVGVEHFVEIDPGVEVWTLTLDGHARDVITYDIREFAKQNLLDRVDEVANEFANTALTYLAHAELGA